VLFCESTAQAGGLPADLGAGLDDWRVVAAPAATSYALKNAGVAAARAPIVAVLDADCRPGPHWIKRIAATFAARPEIAAVSGRTVYAGRAATERALALLTRAYLDPGCEGPTRFISNNNAAFRRDVWLAHPLPEDVGPFGSRLQSEAILRTGGRLWFRPDLQVVHDFEGGAMEEDIRRNIGYGTVATRLADPRMPYAWITRIGRASVPVLAAAKTFDSFGDVLRCYRHYGVRATELPYAAWLAIRVHLLEMPGMIAAFRHRSIGPTAYR
jgi:hypothetical protein